MKIRCETKRMAQVKVIKGNEFQGPHRHICMVYWVTQKELIRFFILIKPVQKLKEKL